MLTRSLRANLGVMISASHNPYQDNGIKLFCPDGKKLSDDVELAIEASLQSDMSNLLATPDKIGRARRLNDAPGRYIEFVKRSIPRGTKFSGMKVVIDCANGAAYHIGKNILWELGADVVEIGVQPDGFNINRNCGSTYPEVVSQAVLQHKADLGIALDGDADRVIMCDEQGKIIDGDQLMAVIASHWQKQGLLRGGGVVATVMSKLGLERYLESLNLKLIRTQVGDRYVAEAMREGGYNVGGEQSGHIILGDYNTTGDGIIATLQVLAVLQAQGKKASEVCRPFTPYPQILRNVRYQGKQPLEDQKVQTVVKSAEHTLGKSGRLLIRKSGTEPVIRIMAEGENATIIQQVVDDISTAVEKAAAQ
jgi:phosphoglucosamine mutase